MAQGASGNVNDNEAIDWNGLTRMDNFEEVCFVGCNVLKQKFHPNVHIIDEEVPRDLAQAFLERLQSAWQSYQPWKRDEDREDVQCAFEGITFRSWKGKKGRMETWQGDDCSFVAFGVGELGLVVGQCGAHPFIHCNSFTYGNSDGSHSEEVPQDDSAEEIFSWALREYRDFCADMHH